MPNGIDRRFDAMKTPASDPVLDRAPSKPELTQLREGDDPVLPFRDRRDRDIRLQKTMTVMGPGKRVGHAAEFAPRRVTRVRRVLRGGA